MLIETKYIYRCDKCGRKIESKYQDTQNKIWNINLGRAGYDSNLDGCDIEFDLCDDCLIEIIKSFTPEGQARVFNSGSRTYGEDEDWIRI